MEIVIAVIAVILIIALIIEYIEYILAFIIAIVAILGIAAIIAKISESAKEKKQARENAMKSEADGIVKKYTPCSIFSNSGKLSQEDFEAAKSRVERSIPEKLASCKELDEKISSILCFSAESADAKLRYLKENQAELDELKIRRDALHEEIMREYSSADMIIGRMNTVVSVYTPAKISLTPVAEAPALEDKGICAEITDFVHNYKAEIAESISLFNEAEQNIADILGFRDADTPEEKLEHLRREQGRLEELRKECSTYRKKVDGRTLRIICDDKQKISQIKKAVGALSASKKCTSGTTDAKKFAPKSTPRDLALFSYECEPAVLFIDDLYFCLFAGIILVFDKNGAFSAAMKPTAFKVAVERKQTKYRFDGAVDSDSKAVTFTEMRTTWVYTKKDGTPDLRYKNNPTIEFPATVDGWEYGVITVKIGSHSAAFTVSSSAALDAFEGIKDIYAGLRIDSKNAVSSTLKIEEQEWQEQEALPPIPSFTETKNIR